MSGALVRCAWAGERPLDVEYHDREWGVPVRDDRALFEMLTLEGAQAGLSWSTVLNKRDGYRRLFAGFDPVQVARFTPARVERLLADPGIVRNRLKVESTVSNARAVLAVQKAHGSLGDFLWQFINDVPLQNRWRSLAEIPAQTDTSKQMSRELKRAGFRFVGPTICYALMQAVGMVNDHETGCYRHAELGGR